MSVPPDLSEADPPEADPPETDPPGTDALGADAPGRPASEDAAVRRTVDYRGRVQGVNFRRSAARVALGYDVAGYVRNEPDGRVHLVAEGRPEVLDAFLADVTEVMDGYITSADVAQTMATGEFRRFDIRAKR